MQSIIALLVVASHVIALANPPITGTQVVAGYLLLNPTEGPAKLKALADNAATIPVNRVYLSFVRPDMVYVPGSNTLQYADIGYSSSGDWGFADVKQRVTQLQAGGVEVFLSMGGWNYNCYPFFYMKNSIASFGKGPNFWKIQQYGAGSVDGCNESNMWCYVCEPQSQNTSLKDFTIFPEPANTTTWQAAQAFISSGAKGAPVQWHPEITPGAQFKDPNSTTITTVPGSGYFSTQGRDPYADLVSLAKDLGLDGVDLDYEEMWHADTFRIGSGQGPFSLDQTVYKYSAIVADIANAIKTSYPSCKLSTAAGAAGAWSTKWWGGNLKGLWYYSNLWYPDLTKFMSVGANAGGINVMTYDLSKNQNFFECPDTTANCDLAGQVNFYMGTYSSAGIAARVGYEIGQPAYPDANNDPTNQIPLTQAALTTILSGVTSSSSMGGFFWELYKSKNSAPTGASGQPDNIDATSVAQQVCAKVVPSAARCKGVIPEVTAPTTNPQPVTVVSSASSGNGAFTVVSSPAGPATTASLAPASITNTVLAGSPSSLPSTVAPMPPTSVVVSSAVVSVAATSNSVPVSGPPAPTPVVGGIEGSVCTALGATQCSAGVTYQCAYYATYSLTWGKWFEAPC
ncbi:hypothetical protein BC830DRAFT_95680 [Chytriomyces sp. MP71]|nr:hypothetical protein BC830DRAFT_95680 [Chytriomyces sp. MP71]